VKAVAAALALAAAAAWPRAWPSTASPFCCCCGALIAAPEQGCAHRCDRTRWSLDFWHRSLAPLKLIRCARSLDRIPLMNTTPLSCMPSRCIWTPPHRHQRCRCAGWRSLAERKVQWSRVLRQLKQLRSVRQFSRKFPFSHTLSDAAVKPAPHEQVGSRQSQSQTLQLLICEQVRNIL
jgi:hypothetical protein